MAWNYDPKTATNGLPEGDYPATLNGCSDTFSKAGAPMRVCTFTVYDGTEEMTVKEYFVEGNKFAVRRMKELAMALGAADAFDRGEFDAQDHLGEGLVLSLIVEEPSGWNKVKGFKTKATTTSVPNSTAPAVEDDLPF